MRYALCTVAVLYVIVAAGVFAMQTQLPVTFGLAVLRSVLWPAWLAGGLHGAPLPMD